MYIAMKLRQELLAMFPEAPVDDILKVVGNLLYYRYMNPAIVAPDALDVVRGHGQSAVSWPGGGGGGVDCALNKINWYPLIVPGQHFYMPHRDETCTGFIAKVLHHSLRGKQRK